MTSRGPQPCQEADPFDLPEWLGVDPVLWSATGSTRDGVLPGLLRSEAADGELACDLVAADLAFPVPAVDEPTRVAVHQAWRHGQIHVVRRSGRLTLAAPGTGFDADHVLDVVARLAKAVGAPEERFSVRLRVTARAQR